jgi:hypothetical protein
MLTLGPHFSPRFWKGGAEAPPFRLPMIGRNSGRGRVARIFFLGPRLFLVHRGRAADLKNRSALRLLKSAVILRSSGDEESRIALKILRARSFAKFTLSGRARFFAALRMTANGFRMTAWEGFSAAC